MSKKYNWVMYLITPVLLALWLYTGKSGWYNLLATCTCVAFFLVALVGIAVIMCVSNDAQFVTKKMQDSLNLRSWSIKLSIFLNLTYSSILIWHDKFIIGGMMLVMLVIGLCINRYVKNLKPEDLAPEKA